MNVLPIERGAGDRIYLYVQMSLHTAVKLKTVDISDVPLRIPTSRKMAS